MNCARIRLSQMPDLAITPLDDLAALAIRGSDATGFLQGQLSQDLDLLAGRGAMFAGLHNPQGRCLAVLRLFHLGADQILLVLPAETAPAVSVHLRRHVLRAKVKIEDANSSWRCYGLAGPDAEAAAETRVHLPLDDSGFRQLILAPRNEPLPQAQPASRSEWQLQDIEAGMPEVFSATAGEFVAQMLNLDAIGAISFEKGCYTGQEIIARAHFRGQVKRRMQLFHTEMTDLLEPGAHINLKDGRRAQVVQAALTSEGDQEFLAVTTLPETTAFATADGAGPLIDALQMPLPYPLPT